MGNGESESSYSGQRLESLLGDGFVKGAKFLLDRYPQIIGAIDVRKPKVVKQRLRVPAGVTATFLRTEPKSESGDVHLNLDVDEALTDAPLFNRAKAGSVSDFVVAAATHNVLIRDRDREDRVGGGRLRLEERLLNQEQIATRRVLLMDESTSMAGGADILAQLVTSAFFLDCTQREIPLTVGRFCNESETLPNPSKVVPPEILEGIAKSVLKGYGLGESTQMRITSMETALDLEKAVKESIFDYIPGGETGVGDAILLAISEISKGKLVEGGSREIAVVTDGELLDRVDSAAKVKRVMDMAREKGVKVKIIYIKDKNIQPVGVDILKDNGCEIVTIDNDILSSLPKDARFLVMDRTAVRFEEREIITLRKTYEQTINIISVLCGITAAYLAASGSALFISKGINPNVPGINIPPWNEYSPNIDNLILLTGLMGALARLIKSRREITELILSRVPVPRVIRKLEDVKLTKKVQITQRLIEAGTMLVVNGRRTIAEKGTIMEIGENVYEVV